MKLRVKPRTVLEYVFSIAFLLLMFLIIKELKKDRYDIDDVMYVTKTLREDEGERKSRYHSMMNRIITVYGYQYDQKYQKAMNRDQRIEYIRENYKLAELLKFGLYDVPTINMMESNFDPWLDHEYGETGLGGMKWLTAVGCEGLLKHMPDNYRRALRIDLKTKQDLKDPIINLKCTYILLWHLRRIYKGRADWYVGIYHWGGFLGKRWDRGEGSIPEKFTLNGKPYNVIKYYINWEEFRTAFELGMLEPSKPIKEKWDKWYARQKKEEIDFRKTKSIIRSLRKEIKDVRHAKEDLEKANGKLDKALYNANKGLKRIAGEVRKGGGIKRLREGTKEVIKRLLVKIKYKESTSIIKIIIITIFCLLIILILYIFIIGCIYSGKWMRNKSRRKESK